VSFQYLALGIGRARLCDASAFVATGKTMLRHRLLKALPAFHLASSFETYCTDYRSEGGICRELTI
jgi:hypothetical protein